MRKRHGSAGGKMEIITLREDYIKLGQALKAAALVEDGVEAKLVIKDGCVTVNGEVDTRRGASSMTEMLSATMEMRYKLKNKA